MIIHLNILILSNIYSIFLCGKLGRIVDVQAFFKEAERNEGMQRIVGGEHRKPDDDGGHIIDSQFLGSADEIIWAHEFPNLSNRW